MPETGKQSEQDYSYELIGTIYIPGYPQDTPIGYYLKDNSTGNISGLSKQEAWQLIDEQGAVNARAVSTPEEGRIIEVTENLPLIESEEWNISAWNESGDLFAPLSEEALTQLHHGMEIASQTLAENLTSKLDFETEMDQEDLYAVKEAINQAKRVTVLTGAGVSTMSGIPDYRSVAMGMWQKDPQLLEHLNEHTFQQDPVRFWQNFYLLIRNTLRPLMSFDNHTNLIAAMKAIRPNETHLFFSWLERELRKDVTVVTQNVDRLHQQAGSEKVVEFHGNVLECSCINCGRTYPLADVLQENSKPECKVCGGELRPDAVFFGDPIKGLEESIAAVERADLVIVAGTSLQVYPFSSLLNHVSTDKKVVYINGELPEEPSAFDYVLSGNLSLISEELKKRFT